MGHRDRSADYYVCRSHRWCHESLPGAWHQAVCLRSLRCLRKALGHQRRNVPTNLHRAWVGHQCYLCKAQLHDTSSSLLLKMNPRLRLFFCVFIVLPQRQRLCHGLRRCYLPAVWSARRPGADGLLTWQHHLRHHLRGVLQEWPPTAGRLRRFQLQRLGHFEGRPRWWANGGEFGQ